MGLESSFPFCGLSRVTLDKRLSLCKSWHLSSWHGNKESAYLTGLVGGSKKGNLAQRLVCRKPQLLALGFPAALREL